MRGGKRREEDDDPAGRIKEDQKISRKRDSETFNHDKDATMLICGWNDCVPLLPVQGEKDIYTHKWNTNTATHTHTCTHTNTRAHTHAHRHSNTMFCFLIHAVTLKKTAGQ